MRKVRYDGFTYVSVKDFTDTYKISQTKLMSHVRSGWSIYESIRYQSACTYAEVFKGTGYKGVEDYVNKNRLSFPIFMRYFEETLDIEGSSYAARDYIFKNGSDLIEFRGNRYRKILVVCNEFGIKEKDVVDRVMLGENLDDVLNDMISPDITTRIKKREGIYVDGKPFDSVAHVAKHYSLNLNALLSRMYHGDSVEISVKKLLSNTFLYKGTYYSSVKEVATLTGVGTERLYRALRKCGDLDAAVQMALEIKNKKIKRTRIDREEGYWNYAGIPFSSSLKMDRAFGLTDGTVNRLVTYDKMTPEEAVDYAIDYKEARETRIREKALKAEHFKKVYDDFYNKK